MQPLYPCSLITSVIELLLVINTKSKRFVRLMGESPYILMMRGILVSRPGHTNPIVARDHSCSKWKLFGSPRALLRLGKDHRQQQLEWLVGLRYRSGSHHHLRNSPNWSWAAQISDRALLDAAQDSNREEASKDCFKEQGGKRRTIHLTRFISRG